MLRKHPAILPSALAATWKACFLLLATLSLAQATDFVDQPLSPSLPGEFSNLGESGSTTGHQQVAEPIVLAQAVALHSLVWSGRYGASLYLVTPVNFSIRIFEDAAGVPSATPIQVWDVAAEVIATGTSYNGIPWQSYKTSVQPIVVGPGIYWISIVESDSRTPPFGNTQWLWGDSDTFATGAFRDRDSENWSQNPGNSRHALIVSGAVLVTIDIKPGSDPNSINLKSKGGIPVAILTTAVFDATQVDWESVQFGPNGATESHGLSHVDDVDDDGDMEILLHFRTQETGIACGDMIATLVGETFGGESITGTDSVEIVHCPK